MKKNDKAKRLMRLFITLMLMASLLLGCSSTEAETETAEAKPEVEAPAEVEEVEKETTVEEKNPEESEPAEAETEATEEEPAEAEEEAPPINYDPVELIDIRDYGWIVDYIDTLEPEQPAIIVFNPDEGYAINMKEGQYYQLKSTDQVLFNFTVPTDGSPFNYAWDFDLFTSTLGEENYHICEIDYSKMRPKHEFYLSNILDSGEKVKITCYFDPPAE